MNSLNQKANKNYLISNKFILIIKFMNQKIKLVNLKILMPI